MTSVSLYVESPVSRSLSLEEIAINISTEPFLRTLKREFLLLTAYTDNIKETFVAGNMHENKVGMLKTMHLSLFVKSIF
jgi:hypothetical protein